MTGQPDKKNGPTKTDAVCALALEGLAPAEIAFRLNCSSGSVRRELSRARQRGATIQAATRVTLTISRAAHECLAAEARRKDTPLPHLAARIIEATCADNLFQAVLDD